jgi:hypothetical protein
MEAIAGDEPHGRSSLVSLQIHFENSGQQLNGLVLHTMILIAQRFPFVNVKNFSDVALRMGPYELMSPGFVDYLSVVGDRLHCQGVTITDSQQSENVCCGGINGTSSRSEACKCQSIPKMPEHGEWIDWQLFAVIITLDVQDYCEAYELPRAARVERMYSQ